MARMGDDYERRRGPVKKPLQTGGGAPKNRVPVSPVRTGGPIPSVVAPKKKLIAMNALASLTGSAPKKKAKKRIGY